jgi:hypothetical protein
VYLRDLRNLPRPKIRRLRSVPKDQWFPRGREKCDPRFWTILQESFYASYVHRGSQLSQHMMLQFTALRVAADGEPILPFFDYQRGLADLVSMRSRYIPDWVQVFYATVYVEADRLMRTSLLLRVHLQRQHHLHRHHQKHFRRHLQDHSPGLVHEN